MRKKRWVAALGSAMLVFCSIAPTAGLRVPAQEQEGEAEDPKKKDMETEMFETEMEGEQTDPEQESETENETGKQEWESDTQGTSPDAPEPEIIRESETESEGDVITETESETDIENDFEEETQREIETELETEGQTEHETETEGETELETETETKAVKKPAKKSVMEMKPSFALDPGNPYTVYSNYSNPYFWDKSWYIQSDFRFTQVEKEYALVEGGLAYVYEEQSRDAKRVGELPYFSLVYILDGGELLDRSYDPNDNGEDPGWVYVESGDVRGFVETKYITYGEYADTVVNAIGEEAFTSGDVLCEIADNAAFTYTHTTVQEVIAEKDYAIVIASGEIREYADGSSRIVGEAGSGSLVYVLAETEDGWYFVESGDVRGFVDQSMVLEGKTAAALVENLGEKEISLASEVISPEENRSCYYTLTSVVAANSDLGQRIAEYAAAYVGRLGYVWAGTSLTYGADCSGFVQSVFSSYGIILPRTAQEQGQAGEAVESLKETRPGDVIYYASGPHVGIYLGNGKVVQCSGGERNTAANPGPGPTISAATYMPITSIRRYVIYTTDTGSGNNRADPTNYTQEQMELIWAIVAQEDNGSYEGALAVISTAMNRTESARWQYAGGNALAQLTAPGQYCYSMDNYWRVRLGGNVPDYVKQAVYDCLKRGIRNNGYTSFRSRKGKVTGNDAVQIGGNWFFGVVVSSDL